MKPLRRAITHRGEELTVMARESKKGRKRFFKKVDESLQKKLTGGQIATKSWPRPPPSAKPRIYFNQSESSITRGGPPTRWVKLLKLFVECNKSGQNITSERILLHHHWVSYFLGQCVVYGTFCLIILFLSSCCVFLLILCCFLYDAVVNTSNNKEIATRLIPMANRFLL